MEGPSEQALLEAWCSGDDTAGQELFRLHFDSIYRFFARKVRNDVADLVQQTFLGAAESRGRIHADSSMRAYLLGVAHNKLLMHFRASSRDANLDFSTSSLLDVSPSPSEALAEKHELQLLEAALCRIPLELQIAVELYYWEELTGPQLAEVLGVPEGTARSRLRRGIELLRVALRELPASDERESSLAGLDAWAARLRALPA
ncbi:MAG: RNA polymerase sigma factor [Polyangiaceae bacterium]